MMIETIGCLLTLVTAPFIYLVRGWAMSVLWAWFVVPTFNAPPLSIPVAIGLAIVIGLLTGDDGERVSSSEKKEQSKEPLLERVIIALILALMRPLIALLIGRIVLLFV